jgi:hypothetical protein
MRDGAGHDFARGALSQGRWLPSSGQPRSRCRFTFQASGVPVEHDTYFIDVASHTLRTPAENVRGDLFIDLPSNRQTVRLIPTHAN